MPAVKTAARYVFSVSVFTLILYLLDANDVIATMAGADIASVVIAIGFALSAQFFSAIRLKKLLAMQEITLSLRKVFLIGLSAIFYGLLIPGGTLAASAARFVQLSRDARVESVAAALVVDRAVATVFLIVIGTVAIAFDTAEPLWVGVIITGVLCSVAIYLFGQRTSAWLTARFDKIAGGESSGRFHRFGIRIGRALSNYPTASGGEIRVVLATSLLAHLSGCLAYYVIAVGLGFDLSFLSICWIRTGMILSTMIPVSVAGLGMREISAIALFIPLGFAEVQAVGFSILIFLVTPVITGLIGGSVELLGATGRR
jgi:hypothetical protein